MAVRTFPSPSVSLYPQLPPDNGLATGHTCAQAKPVPKSRRGQHTGKKGNEFRTKDVEHTPGKEGDNIIKC